MCEDCKGNVQVAANQTGATFNVYGNNGQVRIFYPGAFPWRAQVVRWASENKPEAGAFEVSLNQAGVELVWGANRVPEHHTSSQMDGWGFGARSLIRP